MSMEDLTSIDSHTAQSAGPENGGYDHLVTQNLDGLNVLTLRVTGAHCAHCIQKIEGGVADIADFEEARLNFSTQRFRATWRGGLDVANQLAAKIEGLGYGVFPAEEGAKKGDDEIRHLIACMGVAGFAMANIMLISVGVWAGLGEEMGMATRSFMHWASALIGVPTVLFSGRPFFRSAFSALKKGGANMDVPISLALVLATLMSMSELLNHGDYVYFDSAVMLMFFLLIGRTLDLKARQSARSSAEDLMEGLSGFAIQRIGDKRERIPMRDIRPGMTLLVAQGEKIPADGSIVSGASAINMALVSGESEPEHKGEGDQVYAGTLNMGEPLEILVEKASDDSLLAEIVRLIETAEQGRSTYVRLADKAAQLYTPLVHSLAAISFFVWWLALGADWQESLMTAVTVLIITCPCALGLAVPVVQVLATSRLMKAGVMVKSGDALERLANIDTVFFDKTGTLTIGEPRLVGTIDTKALAYAAGLAIHSRHPLSKALAGAADGEISDYANIQEVAGAGLKGVLLDGRSVHLGNARFSGVDDSVAKLMVADHVGPHVWLKIANEAPRLFLFEDTLRDKAPDLIAHLKSEKLSLELLSGDQLAAVKRVAALVKIPNYRAAMTPHDKYAHLEARKAEGSRIMMVGDGLNDTPVMAAADVSLAPGTAIDMTQASADIVYKADDIELIAESWRVAKRSTMLIRQNFALAAIYNVIAVPMAFAGMVTPLVAAVAMSLSSLVVIGNSYRLGRAKTRAACDSAVSRSMEGSPS